MNRGFRRTERKDGGLIGQNALIRYGTVEAINGHVVTEGEYRGGTMVFRLRTHSRPHQGDLVFGGLIFDWVEREHCDAGTECVRRRPSRGSKYHVQRAPFAGNPFGTIGSSPVVTRSRLSVESLFEAVRLRSIAATYTDERCG